MSDNYGLPTKFVFHTRNGNPAVQYFFDLSNQQDGKALLQEWDGEPFDPGLHIWPLKDIADTIERGIWIIDFVVEDAVIPELEDLL